jgi:membrane protease YdiL (CAAX protease family)
MSSTIGRDWRATSTSSILSRAWNALVHPKVRLNADFPLTGKQLGKTYGIGMLYLIGGTLVPFLLVAVAGCLIYAGIWSLLCIPRSVAVPIFAFLARLKASVNPDPVTVKVGFCVISFLTGFGAQVWYLNRCLKRRGRTIFDAVHLNLKSVPGDSRLAKIRAFAWRLGLVVGSWVAVSKLVAHFFHSPEQPTVKMLREARGFNFIALALLMSLVAPVIEEVVFRGFLFQSLRASFRQGRLAHLLSNANRADVAAVIVSALIFALQHLQFNPVTLVMLFLCGCFLAEVYRRTGTLWIGIAFHAINNGYVALYVAHHR